MGIYPFMFGTIKDFQPVVDELIRVSRSRYIQVYQLTRSTERLESAI